MRFWILERACDVTTGNFSPLSNARLRSIARFCSKNGNACVSKWDRFTAPNVCQTFVVFVPCYFYYKMLRPQFLRLT